MKCVISSSGQNTDTIGKVCDFHLYLMIETNIQIIESIFKF